MWGASDLGGEPFLHLDRLTRVFDGTPAVRELSLEIAEHEIITLLGPSGCGKTTTLRMVAGFERPDLGGIVFKGREISAVAPQRRGFGMVFQHYALFPHLDVAANVGFGLDSEGLSKSALDERVARALELVGLPDTEGRSIGSLSGGQQQRVALARALAPEPQVLLLDEPLSNLDAALRERTRRELRALVKEIGITTIYVTHDQEEAFDLSDRIAVMRDGYLDQVGPAELLYHRPATEFVATFLGRAGEVEGRASSASEGDFVSCRLSGGVIWDALPREGEVIAPDAKLRLLVRPEALEFADPGGDGVLVGSVRERRFAGSVYVFTVSVDGGELEVQTTGDVTDVGDTVGVRPVRPVRPGRPAGQPAGLFAFALS